MNDEIIVILFPKQKDVVFQKYKDEKNHTALKVEDNNSLQFFGTQTKNLFVLIRNYSESTPNSAYWDHNKLRLIDKQFTEIFKEKKIIIAVHWGGMENSTAFKAYIEPNTDRNFKLKNGSIYLTYYSDSNDKIAEKTDIEIYRFIISRLEILSFEYHKRQLINLWLPLAIDIQGLSEVQKNENKANEYFKEIKKETDYLNSLKSFPKDEEFPRWEEIRIELNKGYKDFYPVDLVNEILTKKDFSYFDKKYFSDPKFLPNWLQEVVRVIDEKLKQNS